MGPYDLSSYEKLLTPAPPGDLPANPERGDLPVVPAQLSAYGHVRPDGSVHPGVPPQPEQHHGPPPPSTYGNLPWQQPGYTTAPPYGYADTSYQQDGQQPAYPPLPPPEYAPPYQPLPPLQPTPPKANMRLQSLK